MVQHTSISGAQRKISLGFSQDRATLQVPEIGGAYILKPQTGVYPSLPENEHLTMQLAALFGLEIPPCGLVRLTDQSLAYIIRRFDRAADGRKRRQEDFCQLAVKPPKEKYDGSAELCVKMIRQYSSQPLVDLLKLYRQWVFSWWVGNHDLHLKNLSLLAGSDGPHQLSPVYDLVATHVVIADDHMPLSMGGRTRNFARPAWLRFAAYCAIPERAADRVLQQPARLLERAEQMVARSWLPDEMKRTYSELLRERAPSFLA
jgi:serine/threonine-protein kinase HipA